MDAIVGLGSNLGSREAFLRAAVRLLAAQVEVVAISSLYRTPPLGPPQPDYLNAAVRVRSELDLRALLERTQRVERLLGRVREVRWGPRTVDLDLLFWEGGEVREPDLRVPHPGLLNRAFALGPLLDVAPELRARWGSRLDELGPPRGRAWTRVTTGAERWEARAADDADALALALTAALGDPATPAEVEPWTGPDVGALLAHVAAAGHPAAVTLEDWVSGPIRARIAYDPASRRPPSPLVLAALGDGRCVLARKLL